MKLFSFGICILTEQIKMLKNRAKFLGIPNFDSGLKQFTPEEVTIHLIDLIRKKYFSFAFFFLFDLFNEYAYYYNLRRTSVRIFLDLNIDLPVFNMKCSDNTCVTIRKMENLLLNIDKQFPKIYNAIFNYVYGNNLDK